MDKKRIHKEETKNKISDSMKQYHGNKKETQKSILNMINVISKNVKKNTKLNEALEKLNEALDSLSMK